MTDRPWLAAYPQGVPADIDPSQYPSLVALMEEAFERYASRVAYTFMGKEVTFAQTDAHSRAMGAYLQGLGLAKGERVAIMMPNVPQYPVVVAAVLRAGLVVVNINPLYTPRELEHQFRDSGARALVLLANMAAGAQQVLKDIGIRHVVITELADLHPLPRRLLLNAGARYLKKMVPAYDIPGAVALNRALALGARATHREAQSSLDDVAVLQYTGGTTGVSKGAMLSHGNIVCNVQQAGALFSTYPFREGEELLVLPLPLYHIYAFNACMTMMARGCHTVLIPNPRDLQSLVAAFREFRPSGFAGLNTLFVVVSCK